MEWTDSIRADGVLKDTFILAEDGRRLHGYYLPRHPKHDTVSVARTALLIHGYRNCAIDMMHLVYMYHHSMGYNIVLPDLHAHGQSDGESIQMGWKDRLDALLWCRVADSLFHTPMVVHGISMGAATTMMLSGEENLPTNITHFVEDCGYTSAWDEFRGELSNQFSLPAFPLLHITSLLCDAMYGWNFTEASALRQVAKCPRPMLFIHGDADDFVPTWMVHPLHEAHQGQKQIWLTEGVDHALSYSRYPQEYTLLVRSFLSR
jgi:fermentation-respiration switch protein FrsA (DUF1100 family)